MSTPVHVLRPAPATAAPHHPGARRHQQTTSALCETVMQMCEQFKRAGDDRPAA